MHKRQILFLLGCIPSRVAIAYVAKKYRNTIYAYILASIALIISFGFAFIYIFELRKSGPETFGDKIWWNDLRPIHSANYFVYAVMTFNNSTFAWFSLVFDVVLGFVSFIIKHFICR